MDETERRQICKAKEREGGGGEGGREVELEVGM